MSKVVTVNYTDTTGGTAVDLATPAINYAADYVKKVDDAGSAIITNITSPTDCPNTMRFGMSEISDIYRNSGVTEEYKSPSKRGFSLLSQTTAVYTVTDTVDATYRVDLPLGVHLVIKAPNDANITSTMLKNELMRAVNGLFETDGSLRVGSLARGSMLPADM